MASKSKSRRRVFRASCILAALIVAGSSFAWFTSKDEVTNRLSASGDYDVTIAEDFTPPEKWLPGQKVDKNVGAVNTGNIDAFVRMWLEGEMKVLTENRGNAKWSSGDSKFVDGGTDVLLSGATVGDEGAISTLTKETDETFKNLNLTYYYGTNANKKSLRELDKTNKYANPNNPTNPVDSPDGYSEVMSVQAGGELVYTSNAAVSFVVTPNQTMSFKSSAGDTYDVKGGETYTVTVDTTIKAEDNTAATDIKVDNAAKTIKVKDLASLYKYLGNHIDTNTFKPKTTGLYIFKRNTDMTNSTNDAAITEDCEFAGYYYVAKAENDNGGDGVYFALEYVNDDSQRSEYVLDKAAASSVYTYTDSDNDGVYTFTPGANLALYTAKQQVVENSDLTWTYAAKTLANGTEVEENGVVYTWDGTGSKWTYDNNGTKTDVTVDSDLDKRLDAAAASLGTLTASWGGNDVAGTNDDIKVDINLTNIGTTAEKWTRIAADTNEVGTFYYNNDVEEGASTARLIDSVELNKDTKKQAYLAFDFDLNVLMESQQITIADNGVESGENIKPWTATTGSTNDAATGTITNDDSEISLITWATPAAP